MPCLAPALSRRSRGQNLAKWYRAACDAANAVPIKYNAALSEHRGVDLLRAPYVQDRKALPPIVTSGFVCNMGNVFDALKNGAVAVSTREGELWNLNPER